MNTTSITPNPQNRNKRPPTPASTPSHETSESAFTNQRLVRLTSGTVILLRRHNGRLERLPVTEFVNGVLA